ncbi:MAG: DUF4349 domain-containing protein [Chloroflexota bacterium]
MRLRVVTLMAALLLMASSCSMAPAAAPAPSSVTPAQGRASAPVAPGAYSNEKGATGSADQASATQAWDRYVIRQASLTLIVKDVEAAASEVEKAATAAGGYVSQSNSRRDSGKVLVDLTIQVPAAALDETIEAVKRLAVVVDTANVTSQDVTEEFVDNEARLANLKAAEESTKRLLANTTRIEDILIVERELTRLRGEIEKIEGRQRYLQRRVDMSSITVRLMPETAAAVAGARAGWQPLQNALAAWEASLTFLSQAVSGLLIIVVFLWWVVPLILGVVWWRRRHPSRPRRGPPVQPPTPGAAGSA